KVAPDPDDWDTADGRPATRELARARLSRMLGGDAATVSEDRVVRLAGEGAHKQLGLVEYSITRAWDDLRERYRDRERGMPGFVLSGSGEFIARDLVTRGLHLQAAGGLGWHQVRLDKVRSLTDQLGPAVSACAPAYAVAVLATERPGEPRQ